MQPNYSAQHLLACVTHLEHLLCLWKWTGQSCLIHQNDVQRTNMCQMPSACRAHGDRDGSGVSLPLRCSSLEGAIRNAQK